MKFSENPPIVVGIGASAGGLENIKDLLSSMPTDTGMAFVVLQHLAPDYESLSSLILARCTQMTVTEIKESMHIEPNQVYVLPPNKLLKISGDVLHLNPAKNTKGVRTTIDVFFSSLAKTQQHRAIGVILSGTGTDGGIGCESINDNGGIVITLDPSTTEFGSMPQNVISMGLADYILPIEQMTDVLIKHSTNSLVSTNHPIDMESHNYGVSDKDSSDLVLILNLLRAQTKDDFSSYKKPSVKRRIQRRVEANGLKCFFEYYQFLQNHPTEAKKLRKDLMIRMSSFFRNPNSFEALIEEISPNLIVDSDLPFRVWVPGCSTGEEAYSLAILLMERCSLLNINRDIQIFATDIDEEALEMARKGTYSSNIQRAMSETRLSHYFDKEGKSYVVKNNIRSKVLFIQHNVLSDIPFSKLDLVSCRNLFIYLELDMQKEIIKLFHFALEKNGYLFLGGSESLSRENTQFDLISKKHHIYKRITSSLGERITTTIRNSHRLSTSQSSPRPFLLPQAHRTFFERAKQQLLDEYVPASVLINIKYEVLYFFGPTNQYLKIPEGSPSQNLLMMARSGLAGKIKKAVQTLLQSKKTSVIDSTYVEDTDEPCWVEFKASILKKTPSENLFIITFKEKEISLAPATYEKGLKSKFLIKTLECELKDARAYLQNTIEDLKESNEELKIYNEEIISINEEFQSTNEEMETSKEELQSLNEELTVVNSQLQEKIEEQEKTNNDLINLLRSTDIATIFLDHKLCLKRYTPAAVKMFNLRDSDLGRPLKDLTMRFVDPNLMNDAKKILLESESIELEVETEEKDWYLRKCSAYITADGNISGVIITFANVTRIKILQLEAQIHEQKFQEIFDTLPICIAYVDCNLKYHFSNKSYEKRIGLTSDKLLHQTIKSHASGEVYGVIKPHINKVLSGHIAKFNNKTISPSKDIHCEEIVLLPDIKENLKSKGFFILIFDVTDRQRAAISFLKAVIDISPHPICVVDDHDRYVIVNKAFCEKSGKSEAELLGRTPHEIYPNRVANIIIKENDKAILNGSFSCKTTLFTTNPTEIYMVHKKPFEGEDSEKYIVCSFQDVTEIINSKTKLQKMVHKLKNANEELKDFAHICSHDLQEPARIVYSFAKLFSERFKDTIDEEGKKYLHYILDGSQRMQKMIETTLAYAKISNEDPILAPVNCAILVARIIEELKPSIDEYNVNITYDKLPIIIGDHFKFYHLYLNLISNSVKFRRTKQSKIHIGVKPYRSGYTFFVQDNGIGFDMEFKGRLFKLFGKLNKSEDYPGVGIGLAICKRIVEDSGGKIWVESELGTGTTFYFNIPQKKGLTIK
ncbi:MAG: PAS domain-containing protein [Alphaproteobacteria bacterium]|jgi:two-component system CheB/CheR fusion protein|nr:PAS domain-containing protein [Alphaproteobacteria bacterium]